MIKNRFPKEKKVMGWSTSLFSCLLKKLNSIIPAVATKPMNNLLRVS